MKLIKILGHPIAVTIMFMLIIIGGKHLGGFYLLYILLGLPYGASHALIAVAGLAAMLSAYRMKSSKYLIIKPTLNITGILSMILALVVFFERSDGYNNETFHQVIPLITLGLFALCILCCLINSILLIVNTSSTDKTSVFI